MGGGARRGVGPSPANPRVAAAGRARILHRGTSDPAYRSARRALMVAPGGAR